MSQAQIGALSPNLGAIAIATGLVAVVLAVAAARLGGFDPSTPVSSPVASSAELRFVDASGGIVSVYLMPEEVLVRKFEPGEGSFVRGVMRGLARERRAHGASMRAPFIVSRYQNGRVTLQDPTTGRMIDLSAFGPTNTGAFELLLDAGVAVRDAATDSALQ